MSAAEHHEHRGWLVRKLRADPPRAVLGLGRVGRDVRRVPTDDVAQPRRNVRGVQRGRRTVPRRGIAHHSDVHSLVSHYVRGPLAPCRPRRLWTCAT